MNIVVLVKQVPDSGSERNLAGDNTVDRRSANNVINEMDEDTYATPAFADGRIYVRTTAALYAFGKP